MRSAGSGAAAGRNPGIDLFRGLLVTAVMLGHHSELTHPASFLTWFGSGIRMPLFVGLTGYLFNLRRARDRPLRDLLHIYGRRLLLPWAIACVVYLASVERLDLLSPLTLVVQPPFHLWFVPVIVAFIAVATVLRYTPLTMLGGAIPISIAAMYVFGVGYSVASMPAWMPDRRFFIYPIYFFYGLWVAERESQPWKTRVALILAPIGLIWWWALYRAPDLEAEVAAALTASLPLICLLPSVRSVTVRVLPLALVGRDSLFFYLWHPMAFALAAACGLTGVAMLGFSMLLLAGAYLLCGRLPGFGGMLGIGHGATRVPLPVVPALHLEPEPAR